jgi:alpha-N-arabinofuranosidase
MTHNYIKYLLIFLFFSFSTNAQENFSNPIIPGGYPDPSICKVGDTFYIVNSSFEYFPGLPIHKSKDLINWELIGYGLHRKSQVNSTVNLIDVQSNGGIHAPTIRYKDGVYYIITTNVYYDEEKGKADMVNFIITAENPAGPWSDPIHIVGAPGIDPDLFFDDDGKVWYVGNQMPENPNFDGEGEIWLQELDLSEFKLVGEKHLLWRGACGGVWAEGPHMYKKDGRYYLLIAEGGTSFNHAVMVALSDNIEGPYISNPRNPIITSRHLSYDNWVNSTGHGDIIELDDGRNYMVLLGIRNLIERGSNMGRETFIVPLSWEREPFEWKEIKHLWPVVSPETGRVEILNNVVFNNTIQNNDRSFIDNFETESLHLNWNFRRYPLQDIYQINKEESRLNLLCHPNKIKERGRAALLGFKQTESDFEYLTQMYFHPNSSDSEAGISLFQKDDNYINFTLIKQLGKHFLQAYVVKKGEILTSVKKELKQYQGNIKFKVIAEKNLYKLYYSTKGMHFNLFTTFEGSLLKSNGYTGAHLGVYATGNGKKNQDYASFDYVNYLTKKK